MRRRHARIPFVCLDCGKSFTLDPDDSPECPCGCIDIELHENPRERGDDDGAEYADPRDERDDRL